MFFDSALLNLMAVMLQRGNDINAKYKTWPRIAAIKLVEFSRQDLISLFSLSFGVPAIPFKTIQTAA